MENRINKELLAMAREPTEGVSVEPIGSDKSKLVGRIDGPTGTPYEGGVFLVDFDIPREYPILPLKAKFRTRVYHPNISSQTGAICLDILKDEWSPVLSMKTVLLSLQALLSAPEVSSPLDAVVASHYTKDLASFKETAREWTRMYAKDENASKIAELCELGFDMAAVKKALADANGDKNAAVEILLGDA